MSRSGGCRRWRRQFCWASGSIPLSHMPARAFAGAGRRAGVDDVDYLVQRILNSPDITLRPFTEVTAVEGGQALTRLTWTDRRSGTTEDRRVGGLFVMIGADPNTEWLEGCVPTDGKGFIVTGKADDGSALTSPYATIWPGVFAVGDVRSGSVKRVASGVGDGSVVISAVHQFLAATDDGS